MISDAGLNNTRLSMYKQAQESLNRYISNLVPHEELQAEISNKVLLSLIHEEGEIPNIDTWIRKKTDIYLESSIKNLWQWAYRQARQLSLEQEEAEDLAQNVMITLLNSKKPIQYTRAWIKNTVFKQASTLLRSKSKQSDLNDTLRTEALINNRMLEPSEDELVKQLTPRALKKLLSKEDYQTIMALREYNSLKDFAAAKKISYPSARELKHRVITNLKAKYYLNQGWIGTSAILDYRNLINLKRFVSTLMEHAKMKDFSNMFRYASLQIAQQLEEVFEGVNAITKWEISLPRSGILELCLLDLSESEKPLGVIITVTLNKANHIKIQKCYKVGQILIIPSQKVGPLPVDKGRCLLTLEQIKAYLN